jgi:hypothetical protein
MAGNDVTLFDGSSDFSGGVNSLKVTTVASARTPNGLARNELAWLINATVRDGGITQRWGWQPRGTIHDGSALYQGASIYEPDGANPYIMALIGGSLFRVDPDFLSAVVNETAAFPDTGMPPTQPQAFFAQSENFLVIQSGDLKTLPLFWDGTKLRRSNGVNNSVNGSTPATYALTTTAPWQIPPVGSTVVIALSANYPGQLNDIGTWTTQVTNYSGGTFQVTNIGVNMVTLKTIASSYVGGNYAVGTYNFNTTRTQSGPTNELPAAGPMIYYQGRMWYAQDRIVSAGDIVGDQASGTAAYDFRDAILKVTENPLAIGGDGFSVPSNAGTIRGLAFVATQDTALGQGNLIVATRKSLFSLFVPVTRNDWIAANGNNSPLMTVIQRDNGWVNQDSIVAYNGDLYAQSLEPSIRSFIAALRYFQQWANPPTSSNENRILGFVDRALMHFSSGIAFDNRLLQATLPVQKPQGVVHQAILPLDFTPLSTLNTQRPPNWEGHYDGLDFLKLLEMDFGGRQRAFGIVLSRVDQSIQLWELVQGEQTENGDSRIVWQIETPAWTFGNETKLKKLTGGELWFDQLSGTVDFMVEYRPDGDVCWHLWKQWEVCTPRNSCENAVNPVCYPAKQYGNSYKWSQTLPVPPEEGCETQQGRPAYIGYQFQTRITIKGFCRIRQIQVFGELQERELYANSTCNP